MEFLSDLKILSKKQFGFVGGTSTCDAMYELVDQITSNLNNGKKSIAVFLDLAKAFDTVPHDMLIKTLEKSSIRGPVLDIFRSYLTNRNQFLKISNSLSDPLKTTIGIPQGTVLGPILFIIYINSMTFLNIGGSIISYADDTVLVFSGRDWNSTKDKVANGLAVVKNWLDFNKLTLNLDKTHYIAFTSTNVNRPNFSNIQISEVNTTIKEVSNVKYLGIIIDCYLKWDHHILKLTNSLRKLIYKFYILRDILSKKLLFIIYKALVESLIKYGIVIWGGLYSSALTQLNVTQNYILKVMNKKEKLFSTNLLYDEKVFNVRSLYIHSVCSYVHKIEGLRKYVNHCHLTRSRTLNKLQVPISHKNINQRFIGYLGPKFYNLLPGHIKEVKNLKKFNLACRNYIFVNNTKFITLL